MARESISQTKQHEDKVAENASTKREWEGNHNGSLSQQQQNKEHKVFRAHTARPSNKKEYVGSLPLCTKCNYHHNGQCTPNCNECKKVGHLAWDCKNSTAINQRTRTCFKCRKQGHYKSDCPKLKNRNYGNQVGGTKARRMVYALGGREIN
ncbi:reverse transcriptase domain-containing protein [Tanacetum coccineum]